MSIHRRSIALWAKLGNNVYPDGFHPLLFHLVEVALVARRLWDEVLRDPFKGRFADALGLPVEECGPWVAFWVGAHDIGKACPHFQGQGDKIQTEMIRQYLKGHGLNCEAFGRGAHHAAVTVPVLKQWLCRRQLKQMLSNRIAVAVGGHHGLFQQDPDDPAILGCDAWATVRMELLDELAHRIGVPELVPQGGEGDDQSAFMVLAGLTSVADWVGSNTEFFPPGGRGGNFDDASDQRIRDYFAAAGRQADKALTEMGWLGRPKIARREFGDLFRPILGDWPARPLQEVVARIAQELIEPTLVLVEAPMGEGKTEAAWYVAHCWDARDGQGTYVALPTMATSNQMFDRVVRFLEVVGGGNLMLQHGKAALNEQFEKLKKFAAEIHDEDERPSGAVAEEWFAANKKRGLLAPYGVGTIDQALLAVLQTKHVFVRLFGLAGKCVILDEVHAYDAYMTTLMERLLRWLAALGCPVVLLSATLPRDKRLKLLRAYAGEGMPEPNEVPYPRVTRVAVGGRAKVDAVTADPDRARAIQLGWLGEDALTEKLRQSLANGGCAAVIRNTVRLAQKTYLELKKAFDKEIESGELLLELFHAQFPFGRRRELETGVLARYGKGPDGQAENPKRPKRAILVATQVVEQSLDLDFDLMVSDVAPVDLVLQRAGRLWRHDRPRPGGMTGPQLWLIEPETKDGLPDFGSSECVYARFVLLRSYLVLRALETERGIQLPDDLEGLIERTYGTDAVAMSDGWQAALDEAKSKLVAEQRTQRTKAKGAMIYRPDDEDLLRQQNAQLDEDNPEAAEKIRAATRDTEPTIQIILICQIDGRDYLDPSGQEPFVESDEIDVPRTRRLLKNEVTVSHPGCVRFYVKRSVPSGWQKRGMLRHHRAVRIDATGASLPTEFPLRFDPEVGLCFTREAEEGAV